MLAAVARITDLKRLFFAMMHLKDESCVTAKIFRPEGGSGQQVVSGEARNHRIIMIGRWDIAILLFDSECFLFATFRIVIMLAIVKCAIIYGYGIHP